MGRSWEAKAGETAEEKLRSLWLKDRAIHEDAAFSGITGVAERYAVIAAGLSGDWWLSQGRNVWAYVADAACIRLCSEQYREGHGRSTDKQFAVFLCHARGSLYELETQVEISKSLTYLTAEDADALLMQCQEISRMMNALLKTVRSRPPAKS